MIRQAEGRRHWRLIKGSQNSSDHSRVKNLSSITPPTVISKTVRLYLLVGICVVSVFVLGSEACKSHDQPCEGSGLGDCCGGQNLECYKACPGWRQGRCYYQGGQKPACPGAGAAGVGVIRPPGDEVDNEFPDD